MLKRSEVFARLSEAWYICYTQLKNRAMKTLENLISEQTYMVVDNPSNRFNFFGLVEVTPELVQDAENVAEWHCTEDLPEDVEIAIDVMEENSVLLQDFTGVVTFEIGDETYYLLTW